MNSSIATILIVYITVMLIAGGISYRFSKAKRVEQVSAIKTAYFDGYYAGRYEEKDALGSWHASDTKRWCK